MSLEKEFCYPDYLRIAASQLINQNSNKLYHNFSKKQIEDFVFKYYNSSMFKLKIFARKCAFFITKILLDLIFRITIKGRENIPQTSGALIVANHSSYLDGFVVGKVFYDNLINLKWVISKENYRMWYLRWFYSILQVIVVNGTIEKVKKEFKKNKWVVIFPEGAGRWCPPGRVETRRPGKGAAVIALSSGVNIIPVGIEGTDKVLPARSFKLKPQYAITVHIGKPFAFEVVHQEKIDEALLKKTSQEIMNRIYALIKPEASV